MIAQPSHCTNFQLLAQREIQGSLRLSIRAFLVALPTQFLELDRRQYQSVTSCYRLQTEAASQRSTIVPAVTMEEAGRGIVDSTCFSRISSA